MAHLQLLNPSPRLDDPESPPLGSHCAAPPPPPLGGLSCVHRPRLWPAHGLPAPPLEAGILSSSPLPAPPPSPSSCRDAARGALPPASSWQVRALAEKRTTARAALSKRTTPPLPVATTERRSAPSSHRFFFFWRKAL